MKKESVCKWRKRAEELRTIIDDIDTAGDMFKPNGGPAEIAYFEFILKRISKANDILCSYDGQTWSVPEND